MVSDADIRRTLTMLEGLYNTAGLTTDLATLYSKLGTLELCGWIEDTMDSIARSYVVRNILSPDYINGFDSLLKGNSSFQWENFNKILCHTIGMSNMETIYDKLNSITGNLQAFNGELTRLAPIRNVAAHTTFTNSGISYETPSSCLGILGRIYPAMQSIQTEIDSL